MSASNMRKPSLDLHPVNKLGILLILGIRHVPAREFR
jgi:hypothetical protein